jgi:acyl dehydratase
MNGTTDTSDPRIIMLEGSPNLAVLLARAAATSYGRADRAGHGGALEGVEVRRPSARIEQARLAAYDRVCGFGLRDTLPATYLHVLVFPLQVALMADRAFPFGLPGLVHVRNRITAHRPVDAAETLSLRLRAQALRPHAKGALVDLVGEARIGEELVWEGVSTYLARGASAPGEIESELPVTVDLDPQARAHAIWRVPADTGRRYACVSGDVNPMHLSSLAAKTLGFRRTLAHGMWTKARALAAIEARLPAMYAVDVAFSQPLLLPSVVRFVAAEQAQGWDFAVRPARGVGDHLRGALRAL